MKKSKKKSYTEEELAERELREKKVAELRKSKVQGSIVDIVDEARKKWIDENIFFFHF